MTTDLNDLRQLLQRYAQDGTAALSRDDRERLQAYLQTPEGRSAALAGPCPEIIFLAQETYVEPAAADYWSSFSERAAYHTRLQPRRQSWGRYAAAAALVIVILGSIFVLFTPKAHAPVADAGQNTETFALQHVRPADVLPRIRDLMSEEAVITVSPDGGSLSIADRPENLDRLRRSLAQLDREPAQLELNVKLMQPTSRTAGAMQRVDGIPARDFDFSPYRVLQDFALQPADGRQLRTTIDDRWEVTCFLQGGSTPGTATLVSFSIYDRERKEITVRATSLELSTGMVRTLDTGLAGADGTPLVVAFTLNERR